jgi:Ca-activated chloride channel family protein
MILWLFLCWFAASRLHAQTQTPSEDSDKNKVTFKVNVHLVNVFANVEDEHGAPVAGLTRDDFVLKEDGQPQKVALFERDTALPLQVVLAIDTSGSVHKDFPVEQDAARSFLAGLVRPIDRVEVMEFSDTVREVVPFTSNIKRLENALNDFHRGDATAFYNGVYLASEALAPRSGRKILVVISDGGNTVKGQTYQQALEQAVRDEVMVYSIIDVPIEASAGRDLGGEHAMITLSEQTGGRWYYADASSLQKVFAQVSEDLRTQYLLGYYPPPPRSPETATDFRTIAVTVKNPPVGATRVVHHRPGYYPSE